MTTAEPNEATYEDAVRRITELIRENIQDIAEIQNVSEISFRAWLNQVVQSAFAGLGVTAAKLQAFVDDITMIVSNARKTFRQAYRDAYQDARKIDPV